ncbi:hypothetical protein ACFWIJ_04060, partial [Streptomyces sp. NPDC127079]|uniref:hypothetical protein n=1 Tax=Streptomyces sp. NPDC127079 TaxID=3347132 RepID=UPI00364D6E85
MTTPTANGGRARTSAGKEGHFYDIDDVTLGHRTRVTTQLFDTVKKIRQQRARMPQRLGRPGSRNP